MAPKRERHLKELTRRSKGTNALPLTTRDDRILAQRLEYALRHPISADAVLIDIVAAELLLHRLAPAGELEES